MTGTNEKVKSEVAVRVTAARNSLGFTKRELAKELGVHERTVWNWENGHRAPRGLRLRDLARLTGKPVDFFTEEAA